MPKPNTRFLNHIIRDTKSHNAALLRKEAAESKARLEALEREKEAARKPAPSQGDVRRRQMGNIHAILGQAIKPKPRKANHGADSKGISSSQSGPVATPERGRSTGRRGGRDTELDDDDLFSRKKRKYKDEADESSGNSYSRQRLNRSHSPPRRGRSRSPRSVGQRYRQRSPLELFPGSSSNPRSQGKVEKTEGRLQDYSLGEEMDEDSDGDFVGPQPAPAGAGIRIRGRGKLAAASGIDDRFSANYDPKSDIQPDDSDDWDEKLEAYRDRQKWKQNQEERLKSAGWGDEQIQKWKTGGSEKSEQDVRWNKQGEKREWDRGKVFRYDGSVL